MALVIKPKFTNADIHRALQTNIAAIVRSTVEVVDYTTEQAITFGRSTRTYTDRTKNLRGSIGGLITVDAKPIRRDFSGSEEGKIKGTAVAIVAATKYPKGVTSVLVAGMGYAAAVEARGYDVITGASIQMKADLKKRMKSLLDKINAK